MKATTAKSSLRLGAIPPPPLSHVLNEYFVNALMRYLPLCLLELGSLLIVDVLYLAPLNTTHGEAGLPTSTAQWGGLGEISVRGGV
jgi:hypothetical protein